MARYLKAATSYEAQGKLNLAALLYDRAARGMAQGSQDRRLVERKARILSNGLIDSLNAFTGREG